jgi:hypothetical protein
MENNFSICAIHWLPIYPVPRTILKSNTVQLKLSYVVPYFLANQTHLLEEMRLLQLSFIDDSPHVLLNL